MLHKTVADASENLNDIPRERLVGILFRMNQCLDIDKVYDELDANEYKIVYWLAVRGYGNLVAEKQLLEYQKNGLPNPFSKPDSDREPADFGSNG